MKKRTIVSLALCAALTVTAAMPYQPVSGAEVVMTEQAANALSLNTGSAGLGIDKLSNPTAGGTTWDGTKVYLGMSSRYPLRFRVLNTNNGGNGVLLDADLTWFREEFDGSGSSSWADSDLKAYLNSDYLLANFPESDRNALNSSNGKGLSGEKIFLLSKEEATSEAYGYGNPSARAKYNPKLARTETSPYYLRDAEGSGVATVGSDGNGGTANPTELSWVSPAVNLNPDNVVMTWPAESFKPDTFSIVDAPADKVHVLTIKGGSGFNASRQGSGNVPAGSSFGVSVSEIGSSDWGVTYTQISAMLVDQNRNIIAYGPVSEVAATGETSVEIPSGIPDGNYTVKLYAESVNSNSIRHAVDYASNVVDIPVTVGSLPEMPSDTIVDPGKTSTSNTSTTEAQTSPKTQTPEQAQTKPAATPTPAPAPAAPVAVPHAVSVTSDANGKVAVSQTSAMAGTLIALAATPNPGYHLKGWTSKQVLVAADNTFTMPNQDVAVMAVFEKDAAQKYNITVTQTNGGSIAVSPTTAAAGDKINLSATPNQGYTFVKWNNIITDAKGTYFIMPNYNLEVSAVFQQQYTLSVTTDGNGSAAANPANPIPGQTVKLTAKPKNGYHFAGWVSSQVNPGSSDQFVMPNQNVTVQATFEKDAPTTYSVNRVTAGSAANSGSIVLPYGSVYEPGDTVRVDVSTLMGAQCTSLYVTAGGKSFSLRTDGDTFVMPKTNVTVTATFEPLVSPTIDVPDPGYGGGGDIPDVPDDPMGGDVDFPTPDPYYVPDVFDTSDWGED